jgi:hypothetical protein
MLHGVPHVARNQKGGRIFIAPPVAEFFFQLALLFPTPERRTSSPTLLHVLRLPCCHLFSCNGKGLAYHRRSYQALAVAPADR